MTRSFSLLTLAVATLVCAVAAGQPYVAPKFDGRVGTIYLHNDTGNAVSVTLWHPDNGQRFGTLRLEPGQVMSPLKMNGDTISVGNDWGLQIDNSGVRSFGSVTRWKGTYWHASVARFLSTP